jgi:hypothetical protein
MQTRRAMYELLGFIGVGVAVVSTTARGQTPGAAVPVTAPLFARLSGSWSCAGGFANGRALSADLSFTPFDDGRTLTFSHRDRPPGVFWHRSTWAIVGNSRELVSVGFSGSRANTDAAPVLFIGRDVSDTAVTLVADTLKAPPFTPNRFRYVVDSSGRLLMRWEVQRNGSWALGDSLVCARSGSGSGTP